MTDWVSASAVLLAGVIVGGMLLYGMRRRQGRGDLDRSDLEAKRDALLAQIRSVDNSPAERQRLEREAADVLRKLDKGARPAGGGKTAAEPPPAPAVQRNAALKGFAWGAASVAVLAGIAWFVVQSAKPKESAPPAPAQTASPSANDPVIANLERQVQQDPDNFTLRNDLARAYLDRDDIDGVAAQTQYVLKRSPNDARALTYQALVHIAARQPEAAAAMLQRATKSDPKLLDAWVGLAWLRATQGDLKQAEAAIAEAKKQHPEQSARLDDLMEHLRNPQHPPMAAAANPAPAAPAGAPAAAAEAQPSGEGVRITLNAAAAQYPPTAVIFVIARPAGETSGPPSAAKRIPLGSFPITVELSAADSMMGQPLPPKLRIEARIALGGDAMTHDPKDPTAVADGVALGKSISLTMK